MVNNLKDNIKSIPATIDNTESNTKKIRIPNGKKLRLYKGKWSALHAKLNIPVIAPKPIIAVEALFII